MLNIKNNSQDPAPADQAFSLNVNNAALVVIDPQNDFLSSSGVSWKIFGESVIENDTVANLTKLFKAAENAKMMVAISPHYYYPQDHKWAFGGKAEKLMHSLGMFDREGYLSLE